MLSSKDTVDDRIIGLSSMQMITSKTFNFKELHLRVKNLLKNKKDNLQSKKFSVGEMAY